MAVKGSHIHVIDGKQLTYQDGNCAICGTAKPQEQREVFIPTAYRKGNTIVLKASKLLLGTDTYWAQKNVILHSMKRAQRLQGGGLMRDAQGKLIWESITFRLSLDLVKQYVAELSKLVQDVEGTGNVPQRG